MNGVTKEEHNALRNIEPPNPYDGLAWTTALAIVRERMGAAQNAMKEVSSIEFRLYYKGRYEMARDLLQEMEMRGKP